MLPRFASISSKRARVVGTAGAAAGACGGGLRVRWASAKFAAFKVKKNNAVEVREYPLLAVGDVFRSASGAAAAGALGRL